MHKKADHAKEKKGKSTSTGSLPQEGGLGHGDRPRRNPEGKNREKGRPRKLFVWGEGEVEAEAKGKNLIKTGKKGEPSRKKKEQQDRGKESLSVTQKEPLKSLLVGKGFWDGIVRKKVRVGMAVKSIRRQKKHSFMYSGNVD